MSELILILLLLSGSIFSVSEFAANRGGISAVWLLAIVFSGAVGFGVWHVVSGIDPCAFKACSVAQCQDKNCDDPMMPLFVRLVQLLAFIVIGSSFGSALYQTIKRPKSISRKD